jgi:hypothetical protein
MWEVSRGCIAERGDVTIFPGWASKPVLERQIAGVAAILWLFPVAARLLIETYEASTGTAVVIWNLNTFELGG